MPQAEKHCPLLFVVLALVATLFLTWNLPPFQTPDSVAHLFRANLLTHGQLIAERTESDHRIASGGPSDLAIVDAYQPFGHVPFNQGERVSLVDYAKAFEAHWDGRTFQAAFENTAVYPPFFYLPQAVGIAIGKTLDLPVIQTIYLAQAANAAACILVGFLALLVAGRARLPLFALLLLPMSVSLYASLSQDGLTVVAAALGAAFISRALSDGRPLTAREVWAAAACFALVGMTKQPYAVLGLLLLAVPAEARVKRWAVAASVLVAIGWAVWMALAVQTPLVRADAPTDMAAQLQFLLENPLAVLTIAAETIEMASWQYSIQFVGVLGWLDTPLPQGYYVAAHAVLALAFALMLPSRGRSPGVALPAATVALVLASAALIFSGLYAMWTPVGQLWVDGVQGRYFLPLAALLPLALEGPRRTAPRLQGMVMAEKALAWSVLLFPILSLAVVQRAVILRYYLS